ncbi:MAG: MarR family transcriptional regulator [Candidatus Sericytochromatia bacterium]|nr:MarR family transcriptional regulator [Candidatus Tanganyikabacteria bacterium]
MNDPRYPVPEEESLLPVFRALARAVQAAEREMSRFVADLGLTPSQFDVLATLGDTAGLPFKVLSARSLITGGTLTPVLDRLEAKGLVDRCKDASDQRKVIVKLTPAGQALYRQAFLPFVDHMRARTSALAPAEQAQLVALLEKFFAALA